MNGLDFKKLKDIDPLKPQATVDLDGQATPMDPPDAYAPPSVGEEFTYEELHPYLQGLVDEHAEFMGYINDFADTVESIQGNGSVTPEHLAAVGRFRRYFDEEFISHSRREERELFPLLRQRFLDSGEHSQGPERITPVSVMENEHIEAIRMGAVAFSFLGLAHRIEDATSRRSVLAIAIERAQALVELLKLHIFREDKIVFNLAHQLLRAEEFDEWC